jgi:calcineurin-like phosphoesterase family protein
MEQIFFISDTHFNHKKIIDLAYRKDFESIEEMNEKIVENWNSVVKRNDRVYHLGDFGFHNYNSILERLNGRIFLILGNHDHVNIQNQRKFEWVGTYKKMKIGEQYIVLCHYPFKEWEMKMHGSWNLFGHCHGKLQACEPDCQLDVGVDNIGYFPIEFDQLKKYFQTKFIENVSIDKIHGIMDL